MNLPKLTAPCVNCDKKGCGSYHDKCPKYLEFKNEKEKELYERLKRRHQLDEYVDSIIDGKKRMQRSRRKK